MPIALPIVPPVAEKHYLIAPHSFWGHVRPSIALAHNLLHHAPNAIITLLIPSVLAEASATELQRYPPQADRLHIVHTHVGEANKIASEAKIRSSGAFMTLTRAAEMIEPAVNSLVDAYRRLLELQPLTDALTDGPVDSFEIPPSVALIDITLAAQAIAILPKLNVAANVHVNLLCMAPLSAQWSMWSEVQSTSGKYLGYLARCKEIMAVSDGDRQEAYDKWLGKNEDIIQIPGLPPTHVYEMCPKQEDGYVPLMLPVMETIHQWDGLVNIWPSCLGKEFQAYNEKRDMPCMQVGPQLSPAGGGDAFPPTEDAQRVKEFMDRQRNQRGDNSILYIAFGTLFFSPSYEQLRVMLETLHDLDLPYLLSIGGADAETTQMAHKIHGQNPNLGLIADWMPQSAILAHPALLAFLTHGGSNSVTEAIINPTPLVLWPAAYDQVQTALAFSNEPFKIGVELKQVRNGYNVGRKTAMGDMVLGTEDAIRAEFRAVFIGLQGQIGRELRSRVSKMRDEVKWDMRSGGSKAAMDKLINV